MDKDEIKDILDYYDTVILEDGVLSKFAYELTRNILCPNILFISSMSEITDFLDGNILETLPKAIKMIETYYGISLDDFRGNYYIWRVANYVCKQLDNKKDMTEYEPTSVMFVLRGVKPFSLRYNLSELKYCGEINWIGSEPTIIYCDTFRHYPILNSGYERIYIDNIEEEKKRLSYKY